jgi:hypothetical protein
MDKRIGTTLAGALLCSLALAGCNADHGGDTSNGGGAVSGSGATTAPGTATNAARANDMPSAGPTGTAAVDSELTTVDRQLGVASSDLAQATQSPSDGD